MLRVYEEGIKPRFRSQISLGPESDILSTGSRRISQVTEAEDGRGRGGGGREWGTVL